MNEIIRMRRAEDFFEEFGREAIYKQGRPKAEVKKEMVEALHKEIFQLVADRAKKKFDDIPREGDPEALRIAANVIKDETKKWKKVVDLFERYRETSGVVSYNDITLIPEEGNGEIGFQDGEIVSRIKGDTDGDEVVIQAPQVTDGPVTSGYVAVSEDIPAENEEE